MTQRTGDGSTQCGLPLGWAWAYPEDLSANQENALTIGPFGSDLKVSDYRDAGVPLVFVRNIRSGDFRADRKFVSALKADQLRRHQAQPGDLLVTKMGDPPGDTCLYPPSEQPAIITADCIKWTLDLKAGNPLFFLYALRSPAVRRAIARATGGVAQQKISLEKFRRLRLPVAPSAEQARIVSEIDKHFSRLDAAVAALKRAQANLKRYRAAVLQAAVEGRLENGAGRPSGASPGGREWPLVTVASLLAERPCNGLSVKASGDGMGVPALKLDALTAGGLDYSRVKFLPVSWDAVDDLTVQEGDFFVSRGNGSLRLVGRGAAAQKPPFRVIFPDTMIRLRFQAAVRETGWLPTIWQSRLVRRQVEARAKTTAGIFKISQPELQSVRVPLPPESEQARIVGEVERLLSAADFGQASLAAAETRARHLRASILDLAFSGRLVPQDPHDEPASALLERLRTERGATTTTRKRSSRRKPELAAV